MSSIVIQGDTSGSITVEAPSVAGTHTLTLPKATGNIATDATVGLGTKNLIINGDMRIAQRGTSTASISADGYYTVDRWYLDYLNSYTGVFTQSQDTDVPTGQGFANSLKMLCTTADLSLGVGDSLIFQQRFEGQNLQHLKKGSSNAESITLSFWVKSNKTGTYIAELYDSDNTRQISKSYTISSADTWEKKTITFAGDTTGAFDNDNNSSFVLDFWLGAGSNYSSGTLNTSWAAVTNANRAVGQVNLADATSNYWQITGVQLEIGENATPFEYRMYSQELAMCQRYYESGTRNFYGSTDSSANIVSEETFKVVKRTTPTMVYGTWSWSRSGGSGTGSLINYQTNTNKWSGYIGTGLGFAAAFSGGAWTASSEL
jgi:hypothetical protein